MKKKTKTVLKGVWFIFLLILFCLMAFSCREKRRVSVTESLPRIRMEQKYMEKNMEKIREKRRKKGEKQATPNPY